MPRKVAALLPSTDELLRQLGDRLRLARLRRRLSAKQAAARAGMAPMTLRSLERGGAGVTIGAYAAVMQMLGVEQDLDLLVKADPLGRSLQDSRLSAPRRSAKQKSAVAQDVGGGTPVGSTRTPAEHTASKPLGQHRASRTPIGKARPNATENAPNRADPSRFTNARTLAALLDAPRAARARAKRR